jgi:hypothetical protein
MLFLNPSTQEYTIYVLVESFALSNPALPNLCKKCYINMQISQSAIVLLDFLLKFYNLLFIINHMSQIYRASECNTVSNA